MPSFPKPSEIAQLNSLFRDQITNFTISHFAANVFDEPDKFADFAAAVSTGEVHESLVVHDRLRKSSPLFEKKNLSALSAQLQSKQSGEVDSKIDKQQREYYYLMELLKEIKNLKELGIESDGNDKLIQKLKARATSLKVQEGVRKV